MECAAAAAGRLEQAADKFQARLDAGFLAEFDGSWCFSLEELDRRAGQAKGRLRAVLARVDKEVDDWVVQADCFMNLMLAAAEAGSTAWVPVSFPPAPLVGPVVMRWREGVAAHVVGNTAIVAPAPWDADLHLKRIEGWRGCSLVAAPRWCPADVVQRRGGHFAAVWRGREVCVLKAGEQRCKCEQVTEAPPSP